MYRYEEPDAQGTTALGYVIYKGSKFSYREVQWNLETEKEANIVANAGGGRWDLEGLKKHFKDEDLVGWGIKPEELQRMKDEAKGIAKELNKSHEYTKKVESPVYEVTGEKPFLSECLDSLKADQLIAEIETTAGLSEEEKYLLKRAAYRHQKFNYAKLAELYAHSSKEVQDLMEKSALVIIDFEKAIELGYVKLHKEMQKVYQKEQATDEK